MILERIVASFVQPGAGNFRWLSAEEVRDRGIAAQEARLAAAGIFSDPFDPRPLHSARKYKLEPRFARLSASTLADPFNPIRASERTEAALNNDEPVVWSSSDRAANARYLDSISPFRVSAEEIIQVGIVEGVVPRLREEDNPFQVTGKAATTTPPSFVELHTFSVTVPKEAKA